MTNMKKKSNEAAARIAGLEAAVLEAKSRFASEASELKVGDRRYLCLAYITGQFVS